jgi:hypothetical protein
MQVAVAEPVEEDRLEDLRQTFKQILNVFVGNWKRFLVEKYPNSHYLEKLNYFASNECDFEQTIYIGKLLIILHSFVEGNVYPKQDLETIDEEMRTKMSNFRDFLVGYFFFLVEEEKKKKRQNHWFFRMIRFFGLNSSQRVHSLPSTEIFGIAQNIFQ